MARPPASFLLAAAATRDGGGRDLVPADGGGLPGRAAEGGGAHVANVGGEAGRIRPRRVARGLFGVGERGREGDGGASHERLG
jgi:hypothetical protein